MKCLKKKAEYEFHQLYIFAQETAKAEDFILKTPRLTSRQTNPCNIAAATDEEHFRLGIFILFLDNFIVTLEARFTAHKSSIGEFLLIQLVHQFLNKLKVFKFGKILQKWFNEILGKISVWTDIMLQETFSVERSRTTNWCVEQHQEMQFRCFSEHIYIDDHFVNSSSDNMHSEQS